MEFTGVKIFLALGFFATLISAAFWANDKINEYWSDEREQGEDEDGR